MAVNCNHFEDDFIQFEISTKQGQEPRYTCKLCNQEFSQYEVDLFIRNVEGLR